MYKRIVCILMFIFALAFASSAFAQETHEGCGNNGGGTNSGGGTCMPHEPIVVIVDVMGAKIPIVVAPGQAAPIFRGSKSSIESSGSNPMQAKENEGPLYGEVSLCAVWGT